MLAGCILFLCVIVFIVFFSAVLQETPYDREISDREQEAFLQELRANRTVS